MWSARAGLSRVLAAGLGLAALAAPASGQAPPPKAPVPIPAVEVVATRVPKSTHDVPASVEVISGSGPPRAWRHHAEGRARALRRRGRRTGRRRRPRQRSPGILGTPRIRRIPPRRRRRPVGRRPQPGGRVARPARRRPHRDPPRTRARHLWRDVVRRRDPRGAQRRRRDEPHVRRAGGQLSGGGASLDMGIPLGTSWKSRLSADYDKLGFADDRTQSRKGNALWRVSKEKAIASCGPRPASTSSGRIPRVRTCATARRSRRQRRSMRTTTRPAHTSTRTASTLAAGYERPIFRGRDMGRDGVVHAFRAAHVPRIPHRHHHQHQQRGRIPREHQRERRLRRFAHHLADEESVAVHGGR